MIRKAWLSVLAFLCLSVLAFGQIQTPQPQQRGRIDDSGIRGKIIDGAVHDTDMRIFLNRAASARDRATGLDAEDPDIVDISQMKESFPKKAVQDVEKALEERKKGQIEKATKLLEEAIQLAPNFYHAHNNLGQLYQVA